MGVKPYLASNCFLASFALFNISNCYCFSLWSAARARFAFSISIAILFYLCLSDPFDWLRAGDGKSDNYFCPFKHSCSKAACVRGTFIYPSSILTFISRNALFSIDSIFLKSISKLLSHFIDSLNSSLVIV